ncbi:hypothetical protein CRI94_03780 [Longibacter salinarum]|uniref:DUF5673 domain-containing protein n=1 Tax=Longibacter salinarum TaxID=1850348 RepID=A0A2A8CZP9_9BACT|nr:hypothetical protein [Longibacter salinarum]PEN14172.1 hypothetical protein CRI94_03780 [Longibacter salinarum]
MADFAEILFVLHAVVLSVFVGVTSVSMLLAIISRLRIRKPLLSWRRPSFLQVPIGPSLFLLVVFVAFALSMWTGHSIDPHVIVGYPAGGIFWWVATWLCRSVVVTEYGIIHDMTCINRAISWSQITDYFFAEEEGQSYLVFFYEDDEGSHRRINLPVSEHVRAPFEQLISRKLAPRFRCTMHKPYDEETLDE